MTAPRPTVRSVTAFDPTTITEEIARFVPADVLTRWCGVDRSAHRPRLLTLRDDRNEIRALALLTARPGTAYVKVVDLIGDVAQMVDALDADAAEHGAVAIKWEGWSAGDTPRRHGFSALTAPLNTGVGEPDTGFVRWLAGTPASEPRHYRQTTQFTCGAVCVSIAHTRSGALRLTGFDRSHELGLWREATNFADSDPVRLGHATMRRWPGTEVTVTLDANGPVLVDSYSESERSWRTVLQELSEREAAKSGLPLSRRRMPLAEIRSRIDEEQQVTLLVSLTSMMGIDAPHWVLCHDLVDGAVIVEDPWVSTEAGETWVDAHMLPIADAALDEMSIMENGRYRAAVVIGEARSLQ